MVGAHVLDDVFHQLVYVFIVEISGDLFAYPSFWVDKSVPRYLV